MKRGLNKTEISALQKCKTLPSLAKWENKYIVKNINDFDMKEVQKYYAPLFKKLVTKLVTKKVSTKKKAAGKKKGGRRISRKTKKKRVRKSRK